MNLIFFMGINHSGVPGSAEELESFLDGLDGRVRTALQSAPEMTQNGMLGMGNAAMYSFDKSGTVVREVVHDFDDLKSAPRINSDE